MLLLGRSKSFSQYASALKKAVDHITDSDQLENNDYRRILALQRIVVMNYKTTESYQLDQPNYIYDLASFLPFITYELSKPPLDQSLTTLLGLMTNNYRDEYCVWVNNSINIKVTDYICHKLQEEID